MPQPSAIVLSGAAGVIAAVTSYALCSVLAPFALPVISLPFVLTVLLLLAAARLREHDRWPRSAVPASHPEEVLARHLTHLRRFGNLPWLPFRLPFRGEWFVSQGHDGAHTHRGLWRHGLDFEGAGPDGKPYRGAGNELRDFICYGLPVVAAGAGTVALVEDGVLDNRIGEINVHDNWGNAVVICHGTALFSVYAHLQAKSIKVKVGDVVTPGMEIGRCGNSGRSPTPHLHFQVQRAKHLGSPTIAFDFGDVIVRRDGVSEMGTHLVPGQGSSVRPIQRDESLARLFSFPPGSSYALRAEPGGATEIARVEIDLLGTRYLQSSRGKLYFDTYENGLVLTGYTGAPGSLLRFLLLAAARVPFDSAAGTHLARFSFPPLALAPLPSRPVRSPLGRAAGRWQNRCRLPDETRGGPGQPPGRLCALDCAVGAGPRRWRAHHRGHSPRDEDHCDHAPSQARGRWHEAQVACTGEFALLSEDTS